MSPADTEATSMPKYKWEHPSEWLEHYIRNAQGADLYAIAMELARALDSDQIQNLYQNDMELDGYFTQIKEREK